MGIGIQGRPAHAPPILLECEDERDAQKLAQRAGRFQPLFATRLRMPKHFWTPTQTLHSQSGPWIKELWLYPVSGCAGVPVTCVQLKDPAWGFEFDDEWLIVEQDLHGLRVLSGQRERQALRSIRCALEPHALVLSASGLPPLSLPLEREPKGAQTLAVKGEGARCCSQLYSSPHRPEHFLCSTRLSVTIPCASLCES